MLTTYADDSSDGKGECIFAVAGIVGTQEEWDLIEPKWIERTEGKIFHATDCESAYGDYKGFSKQIRLKEYKDLTNILAQSNMIGFGAVVNIEDYKNTTLHDLQDAPYFHCFVSVIAQFTKWASLIIPQQTIRYIFDINHKVKYNAAKLYEDYIIKRSEYHKYISYMDKILGFANSETVGIQVADLFSHECMKYYYNIYFTPEKRNTRLSMDALCNTKRFSMRYYGKNYLNNLEMKHKKSLSDYRTAYKRWLLENKCNDNANNRIRYLNYLGFMKTFSKA